MQLPRTLDEFRAVINECIQDAAAQVGSRAYSAWYLPDQSVQRVGTVCRAGSPDIDVPEFLRQAGLRAASDE